MLYFFIPTANFATKYEIIIFMNEYRKQTFWIRFFFFSSPFKGMIMNQNLEWPDGKKLPIDLRIFDVITEIQTGWQKRLCKKGAIGT